MTYNKAQPVTRYIKHLADSADFKVGTFNKVCNGLIGNLFEMPNVSYTHPLAIIYFIVKKYTFEQLRHVRAGIIGISYLIFSFCIDNLLAILTQDASLCIVIMFCYFYSSYLL